MPSKRSTKSGSVLEGTVINSLSLHGFQVVKYSDWIKKPHLYGKELLLKNVPYDTIYGHKGRTEFLLVSERFNKKIRIECKWQQISGSVDEKLPYLYLSAIEKMTEDEIIILYGGNGFKVGAIQWLKDSVSKRRYISDPNHSRKINVMNVEEFMAWANKVFR